MTWTVTQTPSPDAKLEGLAASVPRIRGGLTARVGDAAKEASLSNHDHLDRDRHHAGYYAKPWELFLPQVEFSPKDPSKIAGR